MENIIYLNSREGPNNLLKKLSAAPGKESKTFALKTGSSVLRMGYTEDKKKFLDPSGGPMLIVGNFLKEANAVIKSIDFIEDYGYTITFE